MEPLTLPIIKGDRISTDIDYRDALNVNLVAIPREILGASGYLINHSGLADFSLGRGKDRGAVWNERLNMHFRVSGNKFISVATDGTVTELGTISGDDQVSLPYSFNTQAIIADGRYWLYDPLNGFREVVDPNVGNPIDATWIDQYYFFTDGETIYHTNIANEAQINPTDFATSELSPDPTIAVRRDYDNKVMVLDRYTIEYFDNDATPDFAFTRLESRAKSIGCIGTHAVSGIDRGWVMIGGRKEEQPTVYFFTPSTEQKVATREIDLILSEYTEEELSLAVVETRQEDDIQLVLLRLLRHTLLYNHTIAKKFGLDMSWSILRKEIETDGTWPGANGIYDARISKWIYGDSSTTRLSILDSSIASIYGDEIETIFYSPLVKLETFSIDKVETESIPGDTAQDVNVFISATYDGVTFGKEWQAEYGKPNNRTQRFYVRRLGYVRDFVGWKFRSVSKAKRTFAKLSINYG
jgi:hypothetical protein